MQISLLQDGLFVSIIPEAIRAVRHRDLHGDSHQGRYVLEAVQALHRFENCARRRLHLHRSCRGTAELNRIWRRRWNRGISACAVCDGADLIFRNKPLVVIGGGDSAMEEMNFLTKYRSKVYIIHRCDTFRALKIMQQRVLSKPNIEVIWNSSVVETYRNENGKGVLGGLKVKNVVTGDVLDLKMSGLIFAIGHEPATKFSDGQHELDEYGYVVTKPGTTKTSVLLCEAVDL